MYDFVVLHNQVVNRSICLFYLNQCLAGSVCTTHTYFEQSLIIALAYYLDLVHSFLVALKF